jgi:hypothetical protein
MSLKPLKASTHKKLEAAMQPSSLPPDTKLVAVVHNAWTTETALISQCLKSLNGIQLLPSF